MTPLAVFFARPLEARRRALAAAARWEVERQPDAAELLQCLGLDPTPSRRPVRQPRTVPAHDVHSRSRYVPGCPACREVHRRYVARWRLVGAVVTNRRSFARLVRVPQPLRPDSRRRACSGQIELLEVGLCESAH